MHAVKLAYDLHIPKDEDTELCPVIAMHGLFMNKIMLSEMAKKIADETRRKVYCVDLRNHGDSPSPTESNCYMMAADLTLFLQDHNIPKASFICYSFSSRAATVFAIDQPHMVEKLIFMDSFPYADIDTKYNQFCETVKFALERLSDNVDLTRDIEEVKNDIREKAKRSPQIGWTYKFLELLATECFIDEQGVRLKYDRNATMKFFMEGRYRLPWYGCYDGPVLFLMAEKSMFRKDFQGKIREMAQSFPKGQYITISNATHMLQIEKPDECAEAIRKYLET